MSMGRITHNMDLNIFNAIIGQVTSQPGCALIIVALSILAYLLQIWPRFHPRFIPHIMAALGMIFYPLSANRSRVPYIYPYPLAVLVVNGLIAGFISTIAHV